MLYSVSPPPPLVAIPLGGQKCVQMPLRVNGGQKEFNLMKGVVDFCAQSTTVSRHFRLGL